MGRVFDQKKKWEEFVGVAELTGRVQVCEKVK